MKAVSEEGTVTGSTLPFLLSSKEVHFREAPKAGGLVPPGTGLGGLAPAAGHRRLLGQASTGLTLRSGPCSRAGLLRESSKDKKLLPSSLQPAQRPQRWLEKAHHQEGPAPETERPQPRSLAKPGLSSNPKGQWG